MENQENKKTVSFKETPEIINESIIRNTPIIDNHTEINKKRSQDMWQYNQNPTSDELTHYGIMGMKWGVRRYQNDDGSLTSAGKKRYNSDGSKKSFKTRRLENKVDRLKKNKKEDYDSWTSDGDLTKTGIKTNKGETILTPKEVVAARKEQNANYKKAINKTTQKLKNSKLADKLNADASTFEKMMYNRKTRELAAKYVNEQNMTVEEAKSKAQLVAIGNTVALSLLSVAGSVLLTKKLM